MRVAVTASTGRLEGLEAHLRTLGHDVVRAPLVAVTPRRDEATRAAADALRPLRWRLFPSRSAVEAWSGLRLGFDDATLVGAVGPATADAVRALGARVAVAAEPATARGLAAAVLEHPRAPRRGEAVALVQGSGARPALARALTAAGVVPRIAVVYDRSGIGWRVDGTVDAIVVASPSAVAALPDDAASSTIVVAIGPTTAAAARRRGWTVRQAQSPTAAAIVDALTRPSAPPQARAPRPEGSP
ncbi:MAG: uroporphyrinogen-III synthase [Trueperaceae bacterium]|nr:uroporphyrinogen-III synthase [Trueperaceae bacterium]